MDNETFNTALATNIENVRKQAGVSKLALATDARIPYATLHRKLSGVGTFTASELHRITSTLDVSHNEVWP